MKKLFKVLLVLILAVGIIGCGGKPDDMSDESYNTGEKALKIADMYLDGKTDKDEAANSIRAIMDGFSGDGMGDLKVKEKTKQLVSSLYISLSSAQEARDSLAEVLGK